ncbi:MAG: GTPase ObgE [Flavobacteriales bacterium]|jgi:GTP-binding protein|uniref:GTPase ObgE n=1 Tax=Blattabacterium sp. (Mastotermes darwiniensis) TaxID=39768 RepID=UPI000231DE85|nr:GTPase ObgE [Blattabacterium sp. (Mastotermes darwiniensis)]AER40697.1 DNA-binding GTPase involved in cell partioning [Blattabacterium sp. (Mastotermes darwiniensis) str. MADAR]MDR1804775.1 GTPase ObgE [Flavobacteriales bacterium]
MKDNFIDFIKIYCKSGNGGMGCIHFHRDKKKRGPDGGSGGKGGDIILRGNSNLHTYIHLRYKKRWIAKSGSPGKGNNITGSNGKNLFIEVPVGTIVRDINKTIIVEITKDNQEEVLFKGGKGGKGNVFFKSSKSQSPYYAQPGIKTTGNWIFLELKILADVGLIGFPNSGKSTLLSKMTKARPKIGNFSFTTKRPNLGIVSMNYKSFLMADLPGIIENASKGKGLGHYFLRHIERNSVLLFLISSKTRNKKKEYFILLNELKKFNKKLLNKKRLLVISKSDLIDDRIKIKIKNIFLKLEIDIIFISSFTKEGLSLLKNKLLNFIQSI